jgi:LPS-assembly lipoprotein
MARTFHAFVRAGQRAAGVDRVPTQAEAASAATRKDTTALASVVVGAATCGCGDGPGPEPLSRRHLLLRTARAGLAAGLAGPALSGCGFALRRTPTMPFERLHLAGFADASPLAAELRRRLRAAGVTLLATPTGAERIVTAIEDEREKTVVASTTAGQVRELQLRVRLTFRISQPGGADIVPPTELLLVRDMSYSETFALAKAEEEAELYAAMQSDIVQQVMRRLARATPARPVPGAASAPSDPAASAANAATSR